MSLSLFGTSLSGAFHSAKAGVVLRDGRVILFSERDALLRALTVMRNNVTQREKLDILHLIEQAAQKSCTIVRNLGVLRLFVGKLRASWSQHTTASFGTKRELLGDFE